ncbi:MAG: hypothetical protein CSA36_00415 [Draconibacterium sp.]|nr:MAG: hypothetical protein CSA36_00415 [Draconibacterium sp.]
MYRSFSHLLLITCFLIISACKTAIITTSVNTANIEVTNNISPTDSQLIKIYLPYKEALDKDMSRVISTSENEMVKEKPESNLTNFLADLLLEEGKFVVQQQGLNIHPAVSYFNYGGIRTPLPRGPITVGKIYELMPFDNELVFVQITGKQLAGFFNGIAAKGGDAIGGARFVISKKRAKNITIDGTPINDNSNYWVVTNDYIAGGGDGMEVFKTNTGYVDSGLKIRDLIINYLEKKQQKGEILSTGKDGRISYE